MRPRPGGPVVVEKCSVKGSADASKLAGSVSAKCTTDSVFALLSPDQIASIQAAFNGSKETKVKSDGSPVPHAGVDRLR